MMNDLYKPRRLNWFDWLLIALLMIALAGVFFGLRYVSRRADGEDGAVTYTVVLRDWEYRTPAIGEIVRSQNGTAVLGEVIDVRSVPHRFSAIRDGEIVIATAEDRLDHILTVRANGNRRNGDGIRVGDIRVAAGMTVGLRVGDLLISQIKITDVEWEASDA